MRGCSYIEAAYDSELSCEFVISNVPLHLGPNRAETTAVASNDRAPMHQNVILLSLAPIPNLTAFPEESCPTISLVAALGPLGSLLHIMVMDG